MPRPEKEFLPAAMIALRDDGEEPWRYRARARGGTITEHGRVLNSSEDLYIVKIERDRLRVVVEAGPTRLLEWLPRTAFLPVVCNATATASRPQREIANDTGIWIGAGHPVRISGTHTVESHRDGWWRVTNNEHSAFELDAWVPTADVADFFESPPLIDRDPFGFGMFERRGFLARGAAVRARPADDAPVLATVRTQTLVTLTHESDAWIEISENDLDAYVTGFVRRQDVTVRPSAEPDLSASSTYSTLGRRRPRQAPPSRPTPTIPKGTCIFDDRGEKIGLVSKDMIEPVTAASDGRSRLSAVRKRLLFRPCVGDF